jgi:hypothetical protein
MDNVFYMDYIIYMVMAIAGRGRPYFVAEINFDNDRKIELLDEFYKICSTFYYRDIMALGRALRVDHSTVERWKYKVTFPRWDIAVSNAMALPDEVLPVPQNDHRETINTKLTPIPSIMLSNN